MRWMKRLGTFLLFLIVALLLAPTIVPPFLDRIYYRGPATDHFDGQRFFNPEGELPALPGQRSTGSIWMRFLRGSDRAAWPAHVATKPGYPAADGTACPVRPAGIAESWKRCVETVDPKRMFVTWIGHSTVLVQAGGINILTDPILSDRAGPFGISGPRRVRDPGIHFDDLPKIDLILVSHNHYDHMDLATIRRLWERDRPLIVTSLGNDTLIRKAGAQAVTRDWGGRVAVKHARRLADGIIIPPIEVIVERVHHWGSRWFTDRNRALWSGFTVVLPGGNLFFAGDTGPGDMTWPAAAGRHGPVRLALIPIGAFLPRSMMRSNHIGPEEAVHVFQGLGAEFALGIHWGTFQLANEGIDDPPIALRQALAAQRITPARFRTTEVGMNWEIPPIGR